jgi:excisionase family DNA binding protein
MADPEGEILTLEEVAAYLKAGKRTVYRLAQEGKIPAFKLGGRRTHNWAPISNVSSSCSHLGFRLV